MKHLSRLSSKMFIVISTTFLHLILPLDVAEMAFSRCVTTNRGKDEWQHEEVHADSRNLEVMFNYEFLEDFQDEHSSGKQSSDEEGATNNDTRYKRSAHIFLQALVNMIHFTPTVLIPGSQRNSQSTATHSSWSWVLLHVSVSTHALFAT